MHGPDTQAHSNSTAREPYPANASLGRRGSSRKIEGCVGSANSNHDRKDNQTIVVRTVHRFSVTNRHRPRARSIRTKKTAAGPLAKVKAGGTKFYSVPPLIPIMLPTMRHWDKMVGRISFRRVLDAEIVRRAYALAIRHFACCPDLRSKI